MSNTIRREKKSGKYQSAQQAEALELWEILTAAKSSHVPAADPHDRLQPVSLQVAEAIKTSRFHEYFDTTIATAVPAAAAVPAAPDASIPAVVCDSVSQTVPVEVTKPGVKIMTQTNPTAVTQTSMFRRMLSRVQGFASQAAEAGRTFGKKIAATVSYVSRRISRWAQAGAVKALQLLFAVERLLAAAAGKVVHLAEAGIAKTVQLTSQAKQWVTGVAAPSVIRAYNSVLAVVRSAAVGLRGYVVLGTAIINGVAVLAFQSPVFRKYGLVAMTAAYLSLHVFGWAIPATVLLQVVLSYAELNCVAALTHFVTDAVVQVCSFLQLPSNVVYTTAREVLV